MYKRNAVVRSILFALLCAAPALDSAPAEGQQVPNGFPNPFGAATAPWINMTYEQLRPLLAQLPCPLPGLPPELARLVDCNVLRPIPNVVPPEPVPTTPGGTPASVDHRAQGLVGAVRDQGEVGSCEANAIASLIDTYTRFRRLNAASASALHIFAVYERTKIDGVDRDDVANLTRVAGVTTDGVWPYDPVKACRIAVGSDGLGCDARYHVQKESAYTDPGLIAERQRADASPAYRILSIQGVSETGRDGMLLDTTKAEGEIVKLLAAGEAVYLGVDMATNWSSAAGIRGVEVLPAPVGYYGSHALLAQGYRSTPAGMQILVQNSWGTSWGQGGFVWIPEATLRARLRAAYRFRVALTTDPRTPGSPSVQPVPTAPPSAPPPAAPGQTCPQGYSPMFGACVPSVPKCAPGTAPTWTRPCVPG
jgi:Papain family cysteine protease